jgi:hypothetical protein
MYVLRLLKCNKLQKDEQFRGSTKHYDITIAATDGLRTLSSGPSNFHIPGYSCL